MVLQAPGNDTLRLLHRRAVLRVQERKGWHLLPPSGLALVAWSGSERLAKAVAPDDRDLGAIVAILDDDVLLREVAVK